jgi:hypothetical protein
LGEEDKKISSIDFTTSNKSTQVQSFDFHNDNDVQWG